MTILHVIESSGGSADFVLYLLKHLPHHHHCIIYSDRTFAGRLDDVKKIFPNASFYHWKHAQREVNLIQDIKATITLYKLLKLIEADAIHLHSSKAGFLGRLICSMQRRKRVIYTPNGLAFLRKDVSAIHNILYILLEKIANWLSGEVISCSLSEAEALGKKGIRSKYINNGTEIFESTISFGKTGDPIVIATTGRITIQKNPALFNTIAKHFENDPNYQFLWIGGGELEFLLNAKNITVTGWMDRPSVINKLQKADIYISTASWEGLPFAVLEAMNLYKPLLLSNCVGNIDLVQNNYNGYIFTTTEEAIDRIKHFNAGRNYIELLGRRSHKLAKEKFNVRQMASQYEIAYQGRVSSEAKARGRSEPTKV